MEQDPRTSAATGASTFTWLAWVLCPLLALGAAELVARERLAMHWYERAIQKAPPDRPLYAFVGSSRVASAVDTDAFLKALGKQVSHTALNLGQGGSTMVEHYMGLRLLLRKRPSALAAGGAVFVEAPQGLPSSDTWDERWMRLSTPQYLSALVQREDLPRLWNSELDLEDKLRISSFVALGWSQAYLKRGTFWRGVTEHGAKLTAHGVRHLVGKEQPDRARGLDLRALGGVRTDAAKLQRIRAMARNNPYPLPARNLQWDRTVLASIAEVLSRHGVRLVAFTMPLSSPQTVRARNPEGQQAVADFRRHCGEWIDCVDFPFEVADTDFPDLWHLSKTRSVPYSEALANAYFSSAVGR